MLTKAFRIGVTVCIATIAVSLTILFLQATTAR